MGTRPKQGFSTESEELWQDLMVWNKGTSLHWYQWEGAVAASHNAPPTGHPKCTPLKRPKKDCKIGKKKKEETKYLNEMF